MNLTNAMIWLWANRLKVATELSQLFWVVYVFVLPKLYETGIPDPWNNICIIIATLLSAYGFGNSTVAQGAKRIFGSTKAVAKRIFGKK